MSDKYAYLLLGLSILLPQIYLIVARRDMIRPMVRVGLYGGIAGLLAELFYFRDYWRPPSLSGLAVISIEDFIFGFSITSLSFAVFLVLSQKQLESSTHKRRLKEYCVFFLIGLSSMLLFNVLMGVNSIFVSSLVFILLTMLMLYIRPDLIKIGLYSCLIVLLMIICIYVLFFNVMFPEFWSKYWLLYGTIWGVEIFGHVPLTEVIWYASWAFFASISYPFVSGKNVVDVVDK